MVVFEDVVFQRNAATLIELSRLQGVIAGACFLRKIEFYIYAASSWRSALKFNQGKGIKRPELKQQAKEYAKATFGLDLDEDTADAVSMGSAFTISYLKENVNV